MNAEDGNMAMPSDGVEDFTEMTHRVFISTLNKYSEVEFTASPERPENVRDSDMTVANFLQYDKEVEMRKGNPTSLHTEPYDTYPIIQP